ncbi:hypothetical protein EDD38_7321 [Kitasatospora cineracea]|uniref:Uncharacterized protein n=2 Tax=Kitasatospora cineracea TaxID=88074 RepID=A0A3N4R388_9ACTN|nr:hypothetical protein EDD38_7321 [Kitasatospora cineracea]
MIRVYTPVGHAVVVWRGEPNEAAGRHFIEWTVGEDILWGVNTRPALLAEPGVWEEAGRVVLRGRLELVEEPVAVLAVGDSQVLLEVGSPPPPDNIDGTWVEISLAVETVELYPYSL